MQMNLSDAEQQIILDRRRQQADQQRLKVARLLRIAADFQQWKHDSGAGSTYSAFCYDFGYEALPGEKRSQIYELVIQIIERAHEASLGVT